MANIIKVGSTSAGYTTTPDQTGALEIRTGQVAGGTTAVTIDASQNVSFAANATVAGNQTIAGNLSVTGNITGTLTTGFGVGQTWQNVKTTPGRAIGTTYTNSTTKPITVIAGISGVSQVAWYVDGVLLGTNGDSGGYNNMFTFIVPPGSTYSSALASGAPVLQTWVELR